jgi:hypothetical protein
MERIFSTIWMLCRHSLWALWRPCSWSLTELSWGIFTLSELVGCIPWTAFCIMFLLFLFLNQTSVLHYPKPAPRTGRAKARVIIKHGLLAGFLRPPSNMSTDMGMCGMVRMRTMTNEWNVNEETTADKRIKTINKRFQLKWFLAVCELSAAPLFCYQLAVYVCWFRGRRKLRDFPTALRFQTVNPFVVSPNY